MPLTPAFYILPLGRMKHSGKARKAALKIMLLSLIIMVVILVIGVVALVAGTAIIGIWPIFLGLWLLFVAFTFYFFRDPTPRVPAGANLILSPAHGKVDVIDTTTEAQFMGGDCQRISMFLSVINVHVQNAPVDGTVAFFKYTAGQFMNAIKAECALCNENVLLGFDLKQPPGAKVGVRLIAGVLARRIVPFVQQGDEVARGDRISLIQFGSRSDVYLPRNATIKVKVGDKVVGGETVLATFD
jgi:phosphatidylserine decarboxylase